MDKFRKSVVSCVSRKCALAAKAVLLALVGILAFVPPSSASLVTYHISGTGAGALNGVDFANDPFEFLLIGDPSTVSSGIGFSAIDPLVSASVSLAGFGTAVFSIPTRFGLNLNNSAFFSRAGQGGLDLFDFRLSPTDAAAFNFYAPYGPVLGTDIFALDQFTDVPTTLGSLSFIDSSNVFFSTTGSTVPLPAALPLFASGLAGLGLLMRRRKRAQAAA